MATEIAIFRLQPGAHPDDANSAAGQILKETFNTLVEQRGFQQAYWGLETENADIFRLFVDWDSIDAHIEFTKADTYRPFLDRFGKMAELDTAQWYHAHLKPHPASQALSNHVTPSTEIAIHIFSSDISSTDQDSFAETFKQQCVNVANASDKYTASAGGWVQEEVPIPNSSETGKAYVGLIGWQSVEDHMLYRETPTYQKNIKLLEAFGSILKHLDVKHYSGTQINSEPGGFADASGDSLPAIQGEVLNPQSGTHNPPKTRADGKTTKNNNDLKGASNALHKERAGR